MRHGPFVPYPSPYGLYTHQPGKTSADNQGYANLFLLVPRSAKKPRSDRREQGKRDLRSSPVISPGGYVFFGKGLQTGIQSGWFECSRKPGYGAADQLSQL